MASLYTNMKFTGEDIEALGFVIATVSCIDIMDLRKVKKWCGTTCSSTWGFAERVTTSVRMPTDHSWSWLNSREYSHHLYFIYTDEADVLALKLAFYGVNKININVSCIWPSNMPFTIITVEH